MNDSLRPIFGFYVHFHVCICGDEADDKGDDSSGDEVDDKDDGPVVESLPEPVSWFLRLLRACKNQYFATSFKLGQNILN